MANRINHHITRRNGKYYFQMRKRGKRFRVSLNVQSAEEARKARDILLNNLRNYGTIHDPKAVENKPVVLFKNLVAEWMELKKTEWAYSTYLSFQKILRYNLNSFFGEMPVNEIDYDVVMKFLSRLKNVSQKTKQNILLPLRGVMLHAERKKLISRNDLPLIRVKKSRKTLIYPLSFAEVKSFLSVVHSDYRDFFTCRFFTGMRWGEITALKWPNVDFNRKIIRVVESRYEAHEGLPKTPASEREIDLLSPVVAALQRQQQKTFGKSMYIFISRGGHPLTLDNVTERYWKPALKAAGLAPREMKQCRHTFATMMLEAGEPLGWLQAQLGHTTPEMIFRHYYRWIKDYKRQPGGNFMRTHRTEFEPTIDSVNPDRSLLSAPSEDPTQPSAENSLKIDPNPTPSPEEPK